MAVIIALCICFAAITVGAFLIYFKSFGRFEGFSGSRFYTYMTWEDVDKNRYPREELYFHSGKNRLQGFVYGAANNKGLVVISQGLGNNADSYLPMIMFFADKGWRVFAFNNTGVAGSEGKSTRGLYQSLVDLNAALKFIASSSALGGLPVLLLGHSWGGFAVCAVLNYTLAVNANFDKALANELDVDLMERINDFFHRAL